MILIQNELTIRAHGSLADELGLPAGPVWPGLFLTVWTGVNVLHQWRARRPDIAINPKVGVGKCLP